MDLWGGVPWVTLRFTPRLISGTPPACGGAMDASNILKRGLARGSIKLCAATTAAEYRRDIEKDPDLKR